MITFLWWACLIVSAVTFLYAFSKRSWALALFSGLMFSPVSYYFLGAENSLMTIGFIPIIHVLLAFAFWRNGKKKETRPDT